MFWIIDHLPFFFFEKGLFIMPESLIERMAITVPTVARARTLDRIPGITLATIGIPDPFDLSLLHVSPLFYLR